MVNQLVAAVVIMIGSLFLNVVGCCDENNYFNFDRTNSSQIMANELLLM